jgi:hypothetical protein
MENNKDSKPSFWSTIPGMMTALGAIIGASAGLITALYSAGVIGNKNNPPTNQAAIISASPESQSNNSRTPEQTNLAEASRDFMIGRWQVEQSSGEVSGGTIMDYDDDGTFSGSMTIFVGGVGEKQRRAGDWNFQKLSKNTFRLKLLFDDQTTWVGTFKIIDHDHIHNIDQNYIATRK